MRCICELFWSYSNEIAVYLENLINNENSNKDAKIVNEGNILNLDLLIEDDKIKQISKSINGSRFSN